MQKVAEKLDLQDPGMTDFLKFTLGLAAIVLAGGILYYGLQSLDKKTEEKKPK